MSTPEPNDPATARFRRGAGRPVGPPGPPPVRVPSTDGEQSPWAEQTGALWGERDRSTAPDRPISMADLPAPGDPADPATLFDEGESRFAPATTFGEQVEPQEASWPDVDDDPGRRIGVVAIVVGFFVGVVGVFIGVASIRASRRVGLAGALGTAGIVVSVLNIVVGGAVGLSWVRYEVSLQQQCALVGPGQYVTQSGDQVSCG